MTAVLQVASLRKSFGSVDAVRDVSFEVSAGEVFGLLGPNGAGKTTSMMMIAGLLAPDSGTVKINGESLGPQSEERRRLLGVVPQDLAIYPDLTGEENLQFFARLYGLKGELLADRVQTALDRAGLNEPAGRRAHTYSGGMKRRLNFAIALLHEPKLLILDEPTVGVDPQSRSHLLDCVRELAADGMAVVYASHYMEEVEAVCRRVAIVDHGRLLACDTIDALLSRLPSVVVVELTGLEPAQARKIGDSVSPHAEIEHDDSATRIVLTRPSDDFEVTLSSELQATLEHVRESGARIQRIETHEPNLERLFLELTGHRLRD